MRRSFWQDTLQARWIARLAEDTSAGLGVDALEMRRMPTSAERLIAADRAAVWAAMADGDERVDGSSTLAVVGAPVSGLGAKGVVLGPPLPPYGMRMVMYTEVIALAEPVWVTSQTYASTFEHTETLALEDVAGGGTLARITGWHLRPARRSVDLTELLDGLNWLAGVELDRIAAKAEGRSAPGTS